jgi:hypothetical protein
MYPYTKELDSNEAYAIQQSNPDCLAYYPKSTNYPNHVSTVGHFIFQGIYGELNHSVFITALDYATHILNQAAPPEGWGYAAYDKPEMYKGLPNLDHFQHSGWAIEESRFNGSWEHWYNYLFRLTDLARVEEQTEAPIQPTTDWEAKYKELEFKYNEDEIFNRKNKQQINDLQVENYKLKNYIINQLLNN